MSGATVWSMAAGVGVFAWWLTGRVRRYALARQLLDVPNERSSHSVATPRGGGMAIVVAVLLALPLLTMLGAISSSSAWGLLGGGAGVALIGFADDHAHIAIRWRLLGHVVAAVWVLFWIGGLPPLPIFGAVVDLGWSGYGLAAIYVVWLLNVTNFMDGIDGIAAVEAVSVALNAAVLSAIATPGSPDWIAPVVLAAATMGFLIWNWPPAKIFMGDAGSGFLGLTLAALSLEAAWTMPTRFWSWVILLGVFIVDATVTRVRRAMRSWRFYAPHRSHAYQHAAQRWGTHRAVTLAVAAINICWLLPVALLVAIGRLDGVLGVLLAYAPLVVTALWLGAGAESPT